MKETSYCTLFGLARVQKLFTIAISIHIYIRVFCISNIYNLWTFALRTRLIRKSSAKLYAGQMQWVQCVPLAWYKSTRNASRTELDAWLVKCFASAKVLFQCFFLSNLFKTLNLCIGYVKQIMNVFSFVQWDKYFLSVKDEMYHSTPLCLVERNISSFISWKYLYHWTHKHSLFVYYHLLIHN